MSDTAGKVKYFALIRLKRITLHEPFFVVVHTMIFLNIVLCHDLSCFNLLDSQGQNFILYIADTAASNNFFSLRNHCKTLQKNS